MPPAPHPHDPRRLQNALEKTVPSTEFSAEGTGRELERTPQAVTPSSDAQQFLLKTQTDPSEFTDPEDSAPVVGFSTTSIVPPELLEDGDEQEGPRFDVLKEAGRGGTAHVYKVLDRSLGRTIALKLLRGSGTHKKGVKRRFIHEARVTAMLDHPNIVPVYDIGTTEDNRVYFLMKNVTGVSVGDAIRAARDGGDVPPEFRTIDGRLRILLKVCDAMAFAHDRGFIHQDIKPDNIMLGEFGEVLVLDWGCALGERERESGKGGTYGTPAFMSPEQARQEDADERSDIYCLGATLFQMVTLHHPTWSDDPSEFWELKRSGVLIELPDDVRRRVPDALLDIARKAMAPKPQNRYQSVGELQEAIVEYQAHAESIALAARASAQLRQVGDTGDYHEYARITARFEQALEMWEGNDDAADGLRRTRRSHARCALKRGDLTLAASIAAEDPTLADLRVDIEAEQYRRARTMVRARWALLAGGVLGLVLMLVFGYYLIDYFRYFGKWQLLCHVDFTHEGVDLSEVAFSRNILTRDEDPFDVDRAGLHLPGSNMFWARNVRERGDVRVEVVVRWPTRVDGLEIMLNTRREQGRSYAHCPTGYSCQFGGWNGVANVISRNAAPQFPDQGNSVGSDFRPGRTYRLWFQRVGEELSLYIDRKRVFTAVEPLPLAGEGLEWVGVRSWPDVIVESFTVWRMGAPEKASPLIAGDVLVQRGQLRDAAQVYFRLAQDHAGTELEAQALVRTYLAARQVGDPDTMCQRVEQLMRASHPQSAYLSMLLQADCLAAWQERRYDDALQLGREALDLHAHSRVALRMASSLPRGAPASAVNAMVGLVGRSTNVSGLSVENSALSDISRLSDLALRSLDIRSCNVSDIAALKGMPLELLLLSDNPLSDISSLAGTPLRYLEASSCEIEDLSPLAGLPLERLILNDNPLNGISAISTLKNLRDLRFSGTPVSSLEALADMHSLHSLALDFTQVSDLSPLQGLELTDLSMDQAPVTSLGPLSGLPLTDIEASGCPIDDLAPLEGMALEILLISDTRIGSLEPLRGMPIRSLSIGGTHVTDLSPLKGMPLGDLQTPNLNITDLAPLAGAPLRSLTLRQCRVRDLTPLTGMKLRRLEVSGNPLASLAPFDNDPADFVLFDTVSAGPEYYERVLQNWAQSGDTVSARISRTAIAYRRKNMPELRRLATEYNGHRYLFIPVDMRYDSAVAAAAELGAHLATITTEEEERVLYSLPRNEAGSWIGLDGRTSMTHWITGEPVSYRNFVSRTHARIPMPVYLLKRYNVDNCWYTDTRRGIQTNLLVEWDS